MQPLPHPDEEASKIPPMMGLPQPILQPNFIPPPSVATGSFAVPPQMPFHMHPPAGGYVPVPAAIPPTSVAANLGARGENPQLMGMPMSYTAIPSYVYVANFFPMVEQPVAPTNFRGGVVYYDPRNGMSQRRHDAPT